MKKMHIISIIVSVLIILLIAGFFTFKYFNSKYDDFYEPEDNVIEEMIFNDVSENHWASEYISYLTQREIMFGSGDGNFYPDNKVSLGEFTETLLRATMGRLDFENLSGEDFVNVLEKNKVFNVSEITIEEFGRNITKGEVAVYLAKADIKIRNKEQQYSAMNYQDLKVMDDVSQTLISHSISRGFFELNSGNYFYPQMHISRANLAEIIYLFLNK